MDVPARSKKALSKVTGIQSVTVRLEAAADITAERAVPSRNFRRPCARGPITLISEAGKTHNPGTVSFLAGCTCVATPASIPELPHRLLDRRFCDGNLYKLTTRIPPWPLVNGTGYQTRIDDFRSHGNGAAAHPGKFALTLAFKLPFFRCHSFP